jgi:hypothetical protein
MRRIIMALVSKFEIKFIGATAYRFNTWRLGNPFQTRTVCRQCYNTIKGPLLEVYTKWELNPVVEDDSKKYRKHGLCCDRCSRVIFEKSSKKQALRDALKYGG